jgi:RNA-binding protein YlmH
MENETRLEIAEPHARLDKYLAEALPLSRSHIKNAIE